MTAAERSRRFRLRILIFLFFGTLIGALGLLIQVPRSVLAAGYVTTKNYAEVRPATQGVVAKIRKHTGEWVKKGDLLVQLDNSEEQALLEEAQAKVGKAEAEYSRREAEIKENKRQRKEQEEMSRLRLKNAVSQRKRTEELLNRGLVAGSVLEDNRLKEDLARAELAALLARDDRVFTKELAVLRQELSGRRDAVKRAQARLRAKEIRAPISGQLVRYEFVIGELVRPETVLFEIFGGKIQVLKLRVAERYATRVAPGQPYRCRLAPYRGLRTIWFRGKVSSLRHVIQGEGRETYRVAYCSFDPGTYSVPPGTTAEAQIYYGRSSLWSYLFGLD